MLLNDESTPRQLELLEFIRDFRREHKYAPTFREMAAKMGISSTNAVAELVTRLADVQLVSKDPGVSRSVVITDRGEQFLRRRRAKATRALAGHSQRRKSA